MTLDEKKEIFFDILDFQKKTIESTIDLFVFHCEHYLNDNQNNAYGYLDMNDIRQIATLLKEE